MRWVVQQGWKRIWDSEGFQAGQMLNVMAVPGSRNLLRLALRIVAGPGLADPLPQPITPPTPDTLPSPAPVHMSPAATLQHPAPEHNNSSASPHPAANMQPVFENKSSTAAVTAVSDAEGVLVVPAGMSTVTGTGAGTAAAMAPSRMQLPARKPAVRPGPVAPQQDGSFQWRLPAVVPQRLQLPTLVAASLSIQHGQVPFAPLRRCPLHGSGSFGIHDSTHQGCRAGITESRGVLCATHLG